MKSTSNHSYIRQLLRPSIYHLQILLGIRPQGVSLITGCPRSGTSAVLGWLSEQNQVEAFYESRILIGSHRFLTEVERFIALKENQNLLISMIRRLFYTYQASSRYLWKKQLIEKEPLEPTAFPDEQYDEFLRHAQLIIPEIKLIFMVRDPVETIWSMRRRKWGESLTTQTLRSYSLEDCIRIWNSNAEIIIKYASAPNVYICKFDRIISDPINESQRIFKFLSINSTKTFIPKKTKKYAFNNDDIEFILRKTSRQRELLSFL